MGPAKRAARLAARRTMRGETCNPLVVGFRERALEVIPMKRIVFVLLFVISLSPRLVAQDTLPAGTMVPVTLTSSLSSRARPDQGISARVMQRIPLTGMLRRCCRQTRGAFKS